MPERSILIVTTTRAEWSLLQPVVAALHEALGPGAVRVLASGSHLLAEHGDTLSDVRAEAGVPVLTCDYLAGRAVATGRDMAEATGRATAAFAAAFAEAAPDAVVVLGDRYEVLGAATAAVALGLPLAHLEGGHVTEGALDERFRHAITKLADLHYVALDVHRWRLLALGEADARITVTGPLGLDNLRRVPSLASAELTALVGFDPAARPTLVATYHPETVGGRDAGRDIDAVLAGLADAMAAAPRSAIVFTAANLDPGGDVINARVAAFVAAHPERTVLRQSLGLRGYVSLLRVAAGCVGNSSSGLLEAAGLGLPVLDIGDRQKGRDAYGPVTHVPVDREAVARATRAVLETARTHETLSVDVPRAAEVIARSLAAADLCALKVKPPPPITRCAPAPELDIRP